MPSRLHMKAALAVILTLIAGHDASPTLSFPFNAQVPPVAIAAEPYHFAISPATFTSTNGPISYTLQGQPTWLSIDNSTRTLKGTPADQDVGALVFQLVAQDSTGATAASVTLVVEADATIGPGEPVLSQLAQFGKTSAPSTLYLLTQHQFAFNFSNNIFSNVSAQTQFYAVSSNYSPLPNWLQFQPTNLGFSGLSPPLVSPTAAPQVYGITIIASNVIGFAEASVIFELVIGYHILSFTTSNATIDVSPGHFIETKDFIDELSLDNKKVSSSDLKSVQSDAPSWLSLDKTTLSLSGTPPIDVSDIDVTIAVSDALGNSATLSVAFKVSNIVSLFIGDLPSAKASPGREFNYMIGSRLTITDGITVAVDLGNSSSWLHFDRTTLTLHGLVPANVSPGTTLVKVTVSHQQQTQSQSFALTILNKSPVGATSTTQAVSSTTIATTTKSTSTHSPTATTMMAPQSSHRIPPGLIVLTVLLPILVLILMGALIWVILHRHRSAASEQEGRSTSTEPMIPPPAPTGTLVRSMAEVPHSEPLLMTRPITSAFPPQIQLPWLPSSRRSSRRLSKRNPPTPLTESLNSSWGDLIVPPLNASRKNTPDRIPIILDTGSTRRLRISAPLETQGSTPLRLPLQPSQPRLRLESSNNATSILPSMWPRPAGGLPKRLSGVGHGSGIIGDRRSSWRTTLGSMALLESPSEIQGTNAQPVSPTRVRLRNAGPLLRASNTVGTTRPTAPIPGTIRIVPSSSSATNNATVGITIDTTHRGRGISQDLSQYSGDSNNDARNLDIMITAPTIPAPAIPDRSPERARAELRSRRYRHPTVMDNASSGQFSSALSSDTDLDVQDVEATEDQDTIDPEADRRQEGMRTSWLNSDSEHESESDWEDDEDLYEEFGGRVAGVGQRVATRGPGTRTVPQRLPFEYESVARDAGVSGGYGGIGSNQPWVTWTPAGSDRIGQDVDVDNAGAVGRGVEVDRDGVARERGRTRTARRMRREAERNQGVGSPMALI